MVINKIKFTLGCLLMVFAHPIFAQDDDLLGEDSSIAGPEYVDFAFKTTKVVNLQSIEMLGAGVFDFKMNHRFGSINNGAINAFGLDYATIRFGGEYGINQNLMAGIGRSNLSDLKNVDAYLKYRILRQQKGNYRPVTAMVFYGIENKIGPDYDLLEYNYRLTHTAQLIVGKKVSDGFSFQLSPTVVWGNKFGITYSNIALGIGMRQKLTKRTTMNLEYIPVLTNNDYINNSFSVGFDIETGGHVFQIHFTNSKGLNEAQFIANTRETWDTYGIRFGFNLSRVFTIVKPKNNTEQSNPAGKINKNEIKTY